MPWLGILAVGMALLSLTQVVRRGNTASRGSLAQLLRASALEIGWCAAGTREVAQVKKSVAKDQGVI